MSGTSMFSPAWTLVGWHKCDRQTDEEVFPMCQSNCTEDRKSQTALFAINIFYLEVSTTYQCISEFPFAKYGACFKYQHP